MLKHYMNIQLVNYLLTLTLCVLTATAVSTPHHDDLQECVNKQLGFSSRQFLSFRYEEKLHKLEHSFEPWQQTQYVQKGSLWCNRNILIKQDTLVSGGKLSYSKTSYNHQGMLLLDEHNQTFLPVTKEMYLDEIFLSARYSPALLLGYCYQHRVTKINKGQFAVYQIHINHTFVTLYIRKANHLLAKVTTLSDDEFFGDVLTTITYQDYERVESVYYPQKILIDKMNGKLQDEITIKDFVLTKRIPDTARLPKPNEYVMEAAVSAIPLVQVERYNSHISFVELRHTDDRAMIVEFNDFLLVAEAPLNSANGELILKEARRIAPGKPVRYFVFGHYHPHYLGGVRPFIHAGAKILCTTEDQAYVKYLAAAKHQLHPDSLQLEPAALQIEPIQGSYTLSDGHFEMTVHHIGQQSGHTKDYLIYYFPEEKLIFEDDLVWIPRAGESKKAGLRQAGLYEAIQQRGLKVDTIIQSWPVLEGGVKTVIPFQDLKKSIELP
jgi:glyoxylase-like metal-dependent hydrolase (beta-lactamase superfamily II)